MNVPLVVGCGLLGAVVGTFLTVVTASVSEEEPLFVQLRRRVRADGVTTLVSTRSPWMPLAAGAAFAAMAAHFGADAALPAFLALSAGVVALAAVDLRQYLLPNHVLYPTLVAVSTLLVLAASLDGEWGGLRRATVGGVAAFAAMFVVHVINPAGLGFGDVRLSGLLGAALGWLSAGRVVLGLFAGFLAAAVAGVALMAAGRKRGQDSLPFGPFLIAGALVAIWFGAPLLRWYGV
ncbi:MAG: prepilin peptidase [Acidimicrobiales bacterium]